MMGLPRTDRRTRAATAVGRGLNGVRTGHRSGMATVKNPKSKPTKSPTRAATRAVKPAVDHLRNAGEPHQVASDQSSRLTTQQGVPVADDQNTLRVGDRGPALLEDFHFRE